VTRDRRGRGGCIDQGSGGIDRPEDLHTVLLGLNETVALDWIGREGAGDLVAEIVAGGRDTSLKVFLGGPTGLIGGEAQVTTRDKGDGRGLNGHDRAPWARPCEGRIGRIPTSHRG
jgi:hypothetical protein